LREEDEASDDVLVSCEEGVVMLFFVLKHEQTREWRSLSAIRNRRPARNAQNPNIVVWTSFFFATTALIFVEWVMSFWLQPVTFSSHVFFFFHFPPPSSIYFLLYHFSLCLPKRFLCRRY
jgi:hypothetical protein